MRILTLMLCMLLSTTFATKAQESFEKKEYISPRGDTLRYRLLTPKEMVNGEKYPLVLYLHGAGERGSENERQLIHGGQMWLNPVNRDNYPCYVLAPQCPLSGYWAYNERPASFIPAEMPVPEEPSDVFRTLSELLNLVMKQAEVDTDRIYVMGLSMGGMGTYDIVIRHPQLFAAAIPICGTVNPTRLKVLKGSPTHFRIFHGDKDSVVTVEGSRTAYRTLKELGAKVDYHEFVGCTHGSWNPAFNQADFMSWLFGQKK